MKRLRVKLLSILLVFAVLMVNAEIPVGYYTGLNGKTTSELKTALCNIIYDHTPVSSYQALPNYFQKTDVRPNGTEWWEMYSNETFSYPSFSGMNREHSVPKSWWGGTTSIPAYTDLNHLYPSEMSANTAKSNYPLGEVSGTPTFDNGVSKVGYAVTGQGGGASRVFEPADEYKGDFARTYFYMATCYQNLTWKYTYMMQNGTYPTFSTWAIELLLRWHREDPVSQKETNRNDVVYSFQNNRNPFIDYPELAEYIWGNKKGELFYIQNDDVIGGTPTLISPAQDAILDFGEVAIGSSKTMKLQLRGENLTGVVSLVLSQDDKTMFSLSDSEVSATLVNSSEGYWLSVTYSPTALGDHETKLIIYDGGIEGSKSVSILGRCLEVPTLSTIKALPPSSVTSTSYVANWEIPEDETIDYYLVTRTRYVDGSATIEELEAEENYLEITDFEGSDSESYSVQSVRLGYKSPGSNVVFVEHSGISGVEMDKPLAVISYPGWIRIICGDIHTEGVFYDISGKTVMSVPIIENEMEMTLPHGVYFLITNEHRTPVKIIVK